MENYLNRKKLWLLFVFVLTTAFYIYAGVKLATQAQKQQALLADSLMAHVSATLSDHVMRNDLLSLNGYIQDVINQQTTIQKIQVTNGNNEVIAEAGKINFSKAYHSTIEPIEGQILGKLTLWLPENEQEGQLWLFLLWLAMGYGLSRLWKLPEAHEDELKLNDNKPDVIDEHIEDSETAQVIADENRPNPTYAFVSPILEEQHQRIYSNKVMEKIQAAQMASLNKAALLYHAEVKPLEQGYTMLELPFSISEEHTTLQIVSCINVYFETLKLALTQMIEIGFDPNNHNAIVHNQMFDIDQLEQIGRLSEQPMNILLNQGLYDWPGLKNRLFSTDEFDVQGQSFLLCHLSDSQKKLVLQQAQSLMNDEHA